MIVETQKQPKEQSKIHLFPSIEIEGILCFMCGNEIKLNKIPCVGNLLIPPTSTIFYPLCINCISKLGGYDEAQIGFCNE